MSAAADRGAGTDLTEDDFLAMVSTVVAADGRLEPTAAAVLVALHHGIAKDSRTFARVLGIPHAIVLRDVTGLASDLGLVRVVSRSAKTQRTAYELTAAGEALAGQAFGV